MRTCWKDSQLPIWDMGLGKSRTMEVRVVRRRVEEVALVADHGCP